MSPGLGPVLGQLPLTRAGDGFDLAGLQIDATDAMVGHDETPGVDVGTDKDDTSDSLPTGLDTRLTALAGQLAGPRSAVRRARWTR